MTITTKRAMLMMVACGVLWSIGGLFIKLIPWHPLVICGFRSGISGLVALAYMRYKGYRFLFNRSIALCGVMLALTTLLFVCANKLTTSANAIVLQSTAPMFIMLIGALVFHSRYRRSEYLMMLITMGGITLFFLDKLTRGNLLGNILGVLSGLCMAVMFVFTNRLPDDQSSMSSMLFGHGCAALAGIPFAFILPTEATPLAVASILTLGIVQLGIPYVLYAIAIRNCPPLYCSLIGMIEPLLNPVWVFFVVGERPGPFALAGAAVVLVTVAVWCVSDAKRPAQQPTEAV